MASATAEIGLSARPAPGRATGPRERPWPLVALGAAMLAASALLLVLTRNHGLSQDELYFQLYRGGHDAGTFLRPYNEHCVLVPMLLYRVIFRVFGVGSYLPFRLAVVGIHLLCVGLLYALARRRLGPVWALIPALVLLFLGTAWEAILQLALIVFLLPLAGGLAALWLLDRGDRRSDLGACAALLVAVASGTLGVIMALGAAVLIVTGPDRGRRLARVVALPLGLWVLWRIGYGQGHDLGSWADVPRLVTRYVAANFAALAGFDYGSAPVLWTAVAVLFALAVGRALARRVEGWRELLAVVAMILSYWTLVVLFRPGMSELASRYVYPGSALLLLAGAIVVGRRRASPPAIAAGAAVLALIAASQLGDLRSAAHALEIRQQFVGPSLGALELARDRVSPDFVPDPTRNPDVVASRYFAAVDAYGSPADDVHEIEARPEEPRRAADIVSLLALQVALRHAPLPRSAAIALSVTRGSAVPATSHPGCLRLLSGSAASAEMRLPQAGVALRNAGTSPARVRLRRFAGGYGSDTTAPGARHFGLRVFRPLLTPPPLILGPGDSAVLQVPPDRGPRTWYARVTARGGPVLACAAGR